MAVYKLIILLHQLNLAVNTCQKSNFSASSASPYDSMLSSSSLINLIFDCVFWQCLIGGAIIRPCVNYKPVKNKPESSLSTVSGIISVCVFSNGRGVFLYNLRNKIVVKYKNTIFGIVYKR